MGLEAESAKMSRSLTKSGARPWFLGGDSTGLGMLALILWGLVLASCGRRRSWISSQGTFLVYTDAARELRLETEANSRNAKQ